MSSFVAQQMMKQKMKSATGGLTEPLISNKDGGDEENQQGNAEGGEGGEGGEEEEPEDNMGLWDYTIMIGAFTSLLLSGLFLAFPPNALFYIPHGLNMIVVPLVIVSQYRIAKNKSIRGFINKLRGAVNDFAEENGKLTLSIDDLEQENDSLKEFEVGLTAILGDQGKNVDELVRLVGENREIIDRMKKIVQGEIIQILVRAILVGDRDSNFSLDDSDVTTVLMRLDNIEFLDVDKVKLRAFVKAHDGRLGDLLNLVYDIFKNQDELPDEDKIFQIECAF